MTTLFRADFVKHVRKRYPKLASGILSHLQEAYSEWMESGGQYSVEMAAWDRQTNKEMTPQKKLTVVLQDAGLFDESLL